MKLKTLSYSESRETVDARGLKQWKKIGVEIEPQELDDTPDEMFLTAKRIVNKWHEEANPTNYFEQETIPVIQAKDR